MTRAILFVRGNEAEAAAAIGERLALRCDLMMYERPNTVAVVDVPDAVKPRVLAWYDDGRKYTNWTDATRPPKGTLQRFTFAK